MLYRLTVPTAMIMSVLLSNPYQSLGSNPNIQWGKRIWDKPVGATKRIVVDERFRYVDGQQPDTGELSYIWRLFSGDKEEQILFERPGQLFGTGLPPERKPITVIFTGLIDGNLVTVFNQNWDIQKLPEKCWAYRVQRTADDRFSPVPDFDGSLSTALIRAQINRLPDGGLELIGDNTLKQKVRYRLEKFVFHHKMGMDEDRHYWQKTDIWVTE